MIFHLENRFQGHAEPRFAQLSFTLRLKKSAKQCVEPCILGFPASQPHQAPGNVEGVHGRGRKPSIPKKSQDKQVTLVVEPLGPFGRYPSAFRSGKG